LERERSAEVRELRNGVFTAALLRRFCQISRQVVGGQQLCFGGAACG